MTAVLEHISSLSGGVVAKACSGELNVKRVCSQSEVWSLCLSNRLLGGSLTFALASAASP